MLRLKEVTFLYLQLANAHKARSVMMRKPPNLPLLILQVRPTDAEKALLCILWSCTQKRHAQAPTRAAEVSHLPGWSQQPVNRKDVAAQPRKNRESVAKYF